MIHFFGQEIILFDVIPGMAEFLCCLPLWLIGKAVSLYSLKLVLLGNKVVDTKYCRG